MVAGNPDNGIKVLSTRPLSEELVKTVLDKGIQLTTLSFIDTAPLMTTDVVEEMEQTLLKNTTVIFTSVIAVEAVAVVLEGQQPEWKIYCIGYATREAILKYFVPDSIVNTADNAAELADEIIEAGDVEEVFFFCGDQRRPELPDKLNKAGIAVNEIVVYETVATPHKVKSEFAGLLFYSPSAVESFFSVNRLPEKTLVFAIGNTTANAVKKFCTNKIILADEPGKEALVWKAVKILGRH